MFELSPVKKTGGPQVDTADIVRGYDKALLFLRDAWPGQLAKTTFVQTYTPDKEQQVERWVSKLWAFQREELEHEVGVATPATPAAIAAAFTNPASSSAGLYVHNPNDGSSLVWVSFPTEPGEMTHNASAYKEGIKRLFHEAGHIVANERKGLLKNIWRVLKGSDTVEEARNTQVREIEADVFCAIVGIKTGELTREDIRQESTDRTADIFNGADVKHATSRALDQLLLDHTDEQLKAMVPAKIVKTAKDYAEKYASKDSLPELQNTFDSMRIQSTTPYLDLMHYASKADPGSSGFYIAAKTLSSLFATGKLGNRYCQVGSEFRENASQMLRAKAKQGGVDKALNLEGFAPSA